jgi:hypothetical protein
MDGTKVDSDKDEVVSGYVPEDSDGRNMPSVSKALTVLQTDCIQMFCREKGKRQKRTAKTEVCTVEDIK